MRVGLVQLSCGDDPAANLAVTRALIAEAAAGGAGFVATPECTNLMTSDRALKQQLLRPEPEDETLAALRAQASDLGVWLLAGSLLLASDRPHDDPRSVNRSLLIAPDGSIAARYDKIHMFDADVASGESYRESATVAPGGAAVLAEGPVPVGMTICYDMRFPQLYRRLAQAGAKVLTVPAAFTVPTGEAHWHVLLRARAIETGCFVLAPAQCGTHPATLCPDRGGRRSYGHSLVVAPWGEVLADGGTAPGVTLVDIDLSDVEAARMRVASLGHDREFTGP